MNIRSIICLIRAVPQIFKHGFYIPHVYRDTKTEIVTIVADDRSFRVYNNDTTPLSLRLNEKMYKHATLITSKCIYCGKETTSWMQMAHGNPELLKQLYPKENPEG